MLVLGGTQNTDKIPLSVNRQVLRGLQYREDRHSAHEFTVAYQVLRRAN